jgi:uncharacterized protein DUF1835
MIDEVFDDRAPARPRGMLHVVNGDSALGSLRESGVPGEFTTFGDVLYDGPALPGLTPEEWRRLRAEYHAAGGARPVERCLEKLRREDRALAAAREFEEVVVWCEHDLYDQLSLVHLLVDLAERDLGGTKLALVCIGEFPGVARFVGLGQLTPAQIGPLVDTRHPVSREQLCLADETWRAFTSPDPTRVEAVLARDTSALPFLAGALERFLEQFPGESDGLSRTERAILEEVGAGKRTFRALFPAVADREERPFMGDDTFFRVMRGLASGRAPLLAIEGDPASGRLSLTDAGRAVLEGREDAVRLNGIDRWMGGVHLLGEESPWRFDRTARRLVRRRRRASPE